MPTLAERYGIDTTSASTEPLKQSLAEKYGVADSSPSMTLAEKYGQEVNEPAQSPAEAPKQAKPWGFMDDLEVAGAALELGFTGQAVPLASNLITSPVEAAPRPNMMAKRLGLSESVGNFIQAAPGVVGQFGGAALGAVFGGGAGAGAVAGVDTLARNAEQRRLGIQRERDVVAAINGTMTKFPESREDDFIQSVQETDTGDMVEAGVNAVLTPLAMKFGKGMDQTAMAAIATGAKPLVAQGMNVLKQAGFDAVTAIPAAVSARANAENMTAEDWLNPEKLGKVLDPVELLKEARNQAAFSVGAQLPGSIGAMTGQTGMGRPSEWNEPVVTPDSVRKSVEHDALIEQSGQDVVQSAQDMGEPQIAETLRRVIAGEDVPVEGRAMADSLGLTEPDAPVRADGMQPVDVPVDIAPARDVLDADAPDMLGVPADAAQSNTVDFDNVPTVEVPTHEIKMSKDVPNFKAGADLETGVVKPIRNEDGSVPKYIRKGNDPLLLWERKEIDPDTGKGRKEVITGRHKRELGIANDEKTLPAQIVREVDGFTKEMALIADAEINIRHDKGTESDFAQYFRRTGIDQAEANNAGLLSQSKGKTGFNIARNATDNLYSTFINDSIDANRAAAIARAVPGDARAQDFALDHYQKNPKSGASELADMAGFIQYTRGRGDAGGAVQDDLLGGVDTSGGEVFSSLHKAADAERRRVNGLLKIIKPVDSRPEDARAAGIEVKDDADLKMQRKELEERAAKLKYWASDPDMMAEVSRLAGVEQVPAKYQDDPLADTATESLFGADDAFAETPPPIVSEMRRPGLSQLRSSVSRQDVSAVESAPSSMPDWLRNEVDNNVAIADRLGISDTIEELSAQSLTASQVVIELKKRGITIPGDKMDMGKVVRSVRSVRGIPSMDQKTDFDAWLQNRNQKPTPPELPGEPVLPQSQDVAATPTTAGEAVINQAGQPVPNGRLGGRLTVAGRGQGTSLPVQDVDGPAYKSDPRYQRVADAVVKGGTKKEKTDFNTWANKIRTSLFDESRPAQMVRNEAQNQGVEFSPTNDPYIANRQKGREVLSTIKLAMTEGIPSLDGSGPTTPAMRSILEPIIDRMDEFNTLLAARRTPEMESRQQALPFDPKDAEWATQQISSDPAMAKAVEGYDQFENGVMKYIVDSGLMAQDAVDIIKSKNTLYAPWERVDAEGNIRLKGDGPKKNGRLLQRITEFGSEKAIVNPLDTSMKNLVSIVQAAENNAVKVKLADAAMAGGLDAFARPITKEELAKLGETNTMALLRNGEKEYYAVDPEIKKMFDSITAVELPIFDKPLRMQANFFRASITGDPPFALNNVLKDGIQQFAISKSGVGIPFENQGRGLRLLATQKGRAQWKEWEKSASNQAIEYGAIMDHNQLIKDMHRQAKQTPNVKFMAKNAIDPRNWVAGLNKAIQLSESLGRVGEYDRTYQQSIKKGMSEPDARAKAEFESADLGDFSMSGSAPVIKAARKYIPFFGATMSFGYREVGAMRQPGVWAKAIVGLGGMEMLNYAMNKDDETYWDLPQNQRRRYWHVPLGDGEFFAMPKPLGVISYAATAPIELMVNRYLAGDDEYDVGELLDSFADTIMPPLQPPALKVWNELDRGEHGFSDFYDREIVSPALQGLPKEQQFTDRTSLFSKHVGKRLGISPMKSDYFISSGLGSGSRRIVETVIDPAISRITGEKVPGDGLLKSLTKRNLLDAKERGGEVTSRFYDRLNELETEKRGGAEVDINLLRVMRKASANLSGMRKALTTAETDAEKQQIRRDMNLEVKQFIRMPGPQR